jgi:hypothetical protein
MPSAAPGSRQDSTPKACNEILKRKIFGARIVSPLDVRRADD